RPERLARAFAGNRVTRVIAGALAYQGRQEWSEPPGRPAQRVVRAPRGKASAAGRVRTATGAVLAHQVWLAPPAQLGRPARPARPAQLVRPAHRAQAFEGDRVRTATGAVLAHQVWLAPPAQLGRPARPARPAQLVRPAH